MSELAYMAAPPRLRYGPTLDRLMPGLEGKERDLRCSLMLMRDQASAAMNHCRDEAYPILMVIADLANRYAVQPMKLPALEALRYQLVRLISCASGLETFDREIDEAEGSDERG